jgi:hypothetical protein
MIFDLEGALARARMDFDRAPATCRTVWDLLPYEGTGGHALQSGTNAAFHFDPSVTVPVENATCHLQRGDVVFIHYNPRERYDNPRGVSEVVWCYDRYNLATAPGKLHSVVGNVFAELQAPFAEFQAMSARIFTEGRKRLRVTKVED